MKNHKTPGQLAYEQECSLVPDYQHGVPRVAWEELSDIARLSWERNPTPRWTEKPAWVRERESAA